jgi:hypothetical protein
MRRGGGRRTTSCGSSGLLQRRRRPRARAPPQRHREPGSTTGRQCCGRSLPIYMMVVGSWIDWNTTMEIGPYDFRRARSAGSGRASREQQSPLPEVESSLAGRGQAQHPCQMRYRRSSERTPRRRQTRPARLVQVSFLPATESQVKPTRALGGWHDSASSRH